MSDTKPWGEAAPAPSKGPGVVAGLVVAICFAILIGLGVWQLQRLQWKEGILKRVAALQAAPAKPLAEVLKAGGDLDFVRVAFDCPDLERRPLLRLFAVRQGVAGYRLITACPISAAGYGSVLVDRGFAPQDGDKAAMQPGRATLPGPVTGVLRKGDKPTFVTPANRVAQNLWYSRDVAAMAAQLHAAKPVPVYLMIETPPPAPPGPVPAPIPADIPNRHFEYALTWFGLAASLIGVYAAMLPRRRRN
ncbi:MAG TPA: SURF1 family cytochrome oxidase biogenesis protein [Caulobacteraceae bacterium]|jgi:surfeit locus 1 family protein